VDPRNGRVPVWDAAVRLFHWTLAALVLLNLVRDDGDLLHRQLGYVACGVVALRLLWGLVARPPARLSDLKPSWSHTWQYLRALRWREPQAPLGHNPLGVWMVWTLWTLVLLLGLTGWLSRLDAFWGEDWPRDLHALLADALWIALALHLAGVAAMSALQRENLPTAMVTGRKRAPPDRGA